MTSKLDAYQQARDYRLARRRRRRDGDEPKHVDHETITYARQLSDDGSRYITVDELPEMDDEWIDKIVFVRSTVGGEPDRAFLGIQMPDDTLTWIEISLMSPAPPTTGEPDPDPENPPPVGTPHFAWNDHIGSGLLDLYYYSPPGIDVDGSGNIWIGSPLTGTGRLMKFSPGGARLENIALPTGASTDAWVTGVAVQPSNNHVWAADKIRDLLHHYSSGGVDQGTWQPSGLTFATGIAFNAAETLLAVADGEVGVDRVRFYNFPAMTLTQTITGLQEPGGVDFDSAGNIYISDWERHVVFKYNASYTKIDTWGTLGTSGTANKKFNHPYGIHVDAADNVYVVDSDNHRVQVFKTSGVFLTSFGSVGSGNGKFKYPVDVTTFGSTKAYVSDSGNSRISAWDVTT